MERKGINFDNLDVKDYAAKPVITALLYQLLILTRDCPDKEKETTETWDIMYFSLKGMISNYVFEAVPNGQDESNLEKLFILVIADEVSVEQASTVLSNWKRLNGDELNYWINRKFVAS